VSASACVVNLMAANFSENNSEPFAASLSGEDAEILTAKAIQTRYYTFLNAIHRKCLAVVRVLFNLGMLVCVFYLVV
jgi:hypothetical protein